jgi:hypothetical protein
MRPVRRADNLTTFMCRLSINLVASTSWNPKGLSRLVMELLYLYLLCYIKKYKGGLKQNLLIHSHNTRRKLDFNRVLFQKSVVNMGIKVSTICQKA